MRLAVPYRGALASGILGVALLLAALAGMGAAVAPGWSAEEEKTVRTGEPRLLTGESTVQDLLSHPALKAFGRHMLPRPEDAASEMPLRDIGRLMPWHSHVRTDEVLRGVNRLIRDAASGRGVFFPFAQGPENAETGLFFFRGRENAPFALICPGGGFRYVGSLHEGFPLADTITPHGFNAFGLQYRTGGERRACEDMARALSWIFAHAAELKVDVRGYSVWGGSAGARMAADPGSYGAARLGGADIPKPAAVIMAYTGHDWMTPEDPPTFAVVSRDDPIASAAVMAGRTKALSEAGIEAEIRIFSHAGHGFGTGKGTDAEGWMDDALRFWERQLEK